MQGGHQYRRKCDAPSSLWKTLPQSVNKNWTVHRTMKMQIKAQSNRRTNIPQLSAVDTTIAWKDEEINKVHKMDTTFCITDTPGPAILRLPSCSRLRIVHLNCSVQFRKYGKPVNTCPEREKIKQDMKKLKPINSCEDLIKAYPDHFEGIGKFPGTYHMHLKEDAIPVVHAPMKCLIVVRPLVDKNTLSMCSMHNSASKDQTLGPQCSS